MQKGVYRYLRCLLYQANGNEIPPVQISLREMARKLLNLGGQEYDRCTCCNVVCKTNWCKCKKSGRLCNSKCHNSGVCGNK